MVIGLCGQKRHGKDTFANRLTSIDRSYQKLSFARWLKDICATVFGLTEAQVSDEVAKEMLLPTPVRIDDRLDALRALTGLDLRPLGLEAATSRQILQFVGTEYVRSVDPDYWIRAVRDEVLSAPEQNFVVVDVRFPNEADCVRALGGRVVRILRLSLALTEDAKADGHASERLDFEPDHTLATVENDLSLPTLVCAMSKAGGPDGLIEGLRAFDWGRQSFSLPVSAAYYRDYLPHLAKAARGAIFGEDK